MTGNKPIDCSALLGRPRPLPVSGKREGYQGGIGFRELMVAEKM